MVWEFIREFVDKFFVNIEENALFNGIHEMLNFIGLIEVCEEKGLHFNGKEVIEQYWAHCWLYYDYSGIKKLLEVYPKLLKEWGEKYSIFMKKNAKRLILATLLFYDDYGYDFEEDMLVDEVPSILKEFGLYYTKKFKYEIEDITGRYYEPFEPLEIDAAQSDDQLSIEELDYEQAKKEGYEQLLGDPEFYYEEDIIGIIENHSFTKENEEFLLQVIETGKPWYLCEFMVDEISIDLLKQLEDRALLRRAGEDLNLLAISIFHLMTAGRKELCTGLINFCVDYAIEMLYKEFPVISETKFRKMPCYQEYVEQDPELEKLLFTYLFVRQGRWIIIRQKMLTLYLLCNEMKGEAGIDWSTVFDKGWETCLIKVQKGEKGLYFPDFVKPSNTDWMRMVQLIMDEIDKEGFRQHYVVPKLEELLNRYQQEPERAAAFMKDIHWELDIDFDGEICGSSIIAEDTVLLAENLEIADLIDVEDCLAESSLKSLIRREEICEKKDGYITVSVYKEKDEEYLKKIGVYDAWECYFGKMEKFVEVNRGME